MDGLFSAEFYDKYTDDGLIIPWMDGPNIISGYMILGPSMYHIYITRPFIYLALNDIRAIRMTATSPIIKFS